MRIAISYTLTFNNGLIFQTSHFIVFHYKIFTLVMIIFAS